MLRSAFLCLAALAACAPAQPAATLPDPGVLAVGLSTQFARSADAWNRGDLDGFVSDYAADTLTSFIARGHLQRGADWIRQHYAPRFAAGAARDSLRFEEFTVRPLTSTLAIVTARFILYKDGRTTASGPFTLVMARRADGWKILHDHSSSD